MKKANIVLDLTVLMAGEPTWEQKGWGRWEFSVSVKQYSRDTGKLNKDHGIQKWISVGETLEIAKRDAINSHCNQYWTGQNSSYGSPKFVVTGIKTLTAPNAAAYTAYLKNMGSALDVLGKSKDVLQGVADLKNFKKVSAKIGGAGKVLQSIDIMNDLLKLDDYITRYKNATTQEAKDKVTKELVELGTKQLQTLTTIALPPLAWVDLANTVVGKCYDYYKNTQWNNALQDKAKLAKKDQYDKLSWALKPSDDRYRIEALAYMNGSSEADIKAIRGFKILMPMVVQSQKALSDLITKKYKASVIVGGGALGDFIYNWFLKDWQEVKSA